MMKIFDKSALEEMAEVVDGEEYIFEYVDCGHVYQDVCINYNGGRYYKTDSCYSDIKTGEPSDCYYRYDEDDDFDLIVRCSSSSFERH